MKYSLVILLFWVVLNRCFCGVSGGNKDEIEGKSADENECLMDENDRGYERVRDGVYLFYWLLRKTTVNDDDSHTIPLAIYLDGGPGASAVGELNFGVIGPCDTHLERRKRSWLNHMHLLLIDSPVGVGYSYFTKNEYRATSDETIVDDLFVLLDKFFKKHDTLRKAPLHIFGNSYGGKTAVELTLLLREKQFDCNLKSVTSISGWISPADSTSGYASFLFQLGFIDRKGFNLLRREAKDVEKKMKADKIWEACDKSQDILISIQQTYSVNVYNVQHLEPVEHNVETSEHDDENISFGVEHEIPELTDLMRGKVKRALQVRDKVVWSAWVPLVKDALHGTIYKPAYENVKKLMDDNEIRVNIVTGQYDLIISLPGTLNWVERLVNSDWNDIDGPNTDRKRGIITVNDVLNAYFQKHKLLTMYTVLNVGHSPILDNQQIMERILMKIIKESP